MAVQCSPGTFSYRISAGDTLYGLAGRYSTTVQAIIAANQGLNPNALYIGQLICIPKRQQPGTCPSGYTQYVIKAADTIYAIAQRYGITVQAIIVANPGINPNALYIGQSICIPAPTATQDCAIVLSLSGTAIPALPTVAGGVVLIQQSGEGNFAFTFATRGLPSPDAFGNFNAYVGTTNIGGQVYLVSLGQSQQFEQEPTWSGTRIISANPFLLPNNTVSIAPFNSQSGVRANPILRSTVSQCRR